MQNMKAALKIVEGIADHAARAVVNTEECKLLASLVERLKPFLQPLEQHPSDDPSMLTALDLVFDALDEADRVIETCCKSTFLPKMLCARGNSGMLKHAAQRLEQALQQVPLTSLSITGEMHECVLAVGEDLRRANFDSAGTSTHHSRALKEEMEKASNKIREVTEEMKSIVTDRLKEHSRSIDTRLQDLDALKVYILQAQTDKDRLQEFALQQMIGMISESIQQKGTAPPQDVADAVLDQLRCPISMEVMKDPVILKDSGVTYERASIVQWLGKGHREDPMTKIEIRSGELIPNRMAKSMANTAFGIEGSADWQTETTEEPSLEAGLYEGYGQHKQRDGTVESAYLLICLDPDGRVHGYVIAEVKDSDREQHFLILGGKWEASNRIVFFADTHVKYEGRLSTTATSQRAFSFVGTTTPSEDSSSVSFEYPQLAPPQLQRSLLLRSGFLEMEGAVVGTKGEEYRSKALILLSKNSELRGWLSIQKSPGSIYAGTVLSGGWEMDGSMHLSLYFPPSENEPLNSPSAPSNFLARYKLDGNLTIGDSVGHRQGTTYAGTWRMAGLGEDIALDTTYQTLISGLETFGKFSYHCFRRPSERLPVPLRNKVSPLLLPSESVRIIDPGFKRFRVLGNRYLFSANSGCFRDTRDASTAYGFWHEHFHNALTICVEATDRPNEFFIKIHIQRSDVPSEPRAGSYLTVLSRTPDEEAQGTHYCCFVPPESKNRACVWRLEYVGDGDDVYATVVKHNDAAASQFVGHVLASPEEPRDHRDRYSVYASVSPLREKALPITLLDDSGTLLQGNDNDRSITRVINWYRGFRGSGDHRDVA